MKVTIEHKERNEGLFRRRVIYEVYLTVQFNAEERAIIKKTDAGEMLIMRRDLPLRVRGKLDPVDDAKLIRKFDLTPNKLIEETDRHDFENPVEARHYADDLREQLEKLKYYLDHNAIAPSGSTSFEL